MRGSRIHTLSAIWCTQVVGTCTLAGRGASSSRAVAHPLTRVCRPSCVRGCATAPRSNPASCVASHLRPPERAGQLGEARPAVKPLLDPLPFQKRDAPTGFVHGPLFFFQFFGQKTPQNRKGLSLFFSRGVFRLSATVALESESLRWPLALEMRSFARESEPEGRGRTGGAAAFGPCGIISVHDRRADQTLLSCTAH